MIMVQGDSRTSAQRSRSEAGRNRSIEPGLSPPVFCIWLLARPLHSEHSLQNTEHLHPRVISQNTQPLNQPISIDSPELINNLVSIFVIKSATYAKRIVMTTYCKWRNDKRAEMKIKLIRVTSTHGLGFLITDPRVGLSDTR